MLWMNWRHPGLDSGSSSNQRLHSELPFLPGWSPYYPSRAVWSTSTHSLLQWGAVAVLLAVLSLAVLACSSRLGGW